VAADSGRKFSAAAMAAVVRRYGGDYRCLHFATHGQFSPENPLQSALLLSPDARSDGMQQTDKLDALRKAQLETQVKYPHPYYWSAFQLTGRAK
jgi:CHAT domain-containing protein